MVANQMHTLLRFRPELRPDWALSGWQFGCV